MPVPRPPKFLARRSYRRRRMIDAVRVLPLLAAFLFFIPVLWRPSETPEPDTARGGIYVFAMWTALILAALILSKLLERAERDTDETDDVAGGTR